METFLVLKENDPAPVAPLGDVMRKAKDDNASDAGHGGNLKRLGVRVK